MDACRKSCFSGLLPALVLALALLLPMQARAAVHEGFVHVTDMCENVILEIRYFSSYNFVGKRINGYAAPQAILSEPAAKALCKAAATAEEKGYVLKIFDAYRPQAAVDNFVRWGMDAADIRMKSVFYPQVEKARVFDLGYVATRSGHSRGSTVDLTLVDRQSGRELDMGTPFDFFGEASHHGAKGMTPQQQTNRAALLGIMEGTGFKRYEEEWWHYTLKNEPYPDTYFNFAVE
ncbi:MAG: M15 family metallopeptidase [Desulfovibrio sp.]|uniref:M15 family metallopeptidase n=1 Tax=Desulfovibrio sp. TaxID=885 RepID=UPI00135DFFCD|nr:M15 family metallopeptidase [Desulfovibrio sp.]MTJ93738.1 M15 family metallopeptidase [Desulfovibrio sp.]